MLIRDQVLINVCAHDHKSKILDHVSTAVENFFKFCAFLHEILGQTVKPAKNYEVTPYHTN